MCYITSDDVGAEETDGVTVELEGGGGDEGELVHTKRPENGKYNCQSSSCSVW